jgi:2-keto-4-pentenoate hydratase/2-oxohepta-3-ene-1,7-dioic acid hydratase in catechol pathway
MKFATFVHGGRDHIGIVDEAGARLHPISAAKDMLDLVERYEALKGELKPEGAGIPISEVQLKAPIPLPRRNVICVGKNYREHAKEFSHSGFEAGAVKGAEIDEYPAVFTKMPSSVTAPGSTVPLHGHITQSVDYEAELALVIGKGGRDIAKRDAYAHVFGYTIVNDVTARDRQRHHKQWFLGKALDGFCPMGPWITTADELDPENLEVKCWVNGELRQSANTRDLIFDIPTLVETISAGLTLEHGDLIATGTPAGVGIGFNPPKFLKSGDSVRIAISGIGEIENRFA